MTGPALPDPPVGPPDPQRFADWGPETIEVTEQPSPEVARVSDAIALQERIYAATTVTEFNALEAEIATLALADPHRVELLELVAMQRAVVLAPPPPEEESGAEEAKADTSRFTDWSPETIEIVSQPPNGEGTQ